MTGDRVSAELITKGHSLRCEVATDGHRLLDVLNDSGSDYLNVHNVEICRCADDQSVSEFPEVVVRKSNVILAVLDGDKHEAPERRTNSFAAKDRYDVFFTTSSYEVRGKLHLSSHLDAASFLSRDADNFVPITDASVSFAGGSAYESRRQLVMAKKSSIDLLHLTEDEQSTEALLDSIRALMND